MKSFAISFEHEGRAYKCLTEKFKGKGGDIYIIHLTHRLLIEKCKASKISCCHNSIKEYSEHETLLSSLMMDIWDAIQRRESEFAAATWLRLPAWFN
jgi:hypothetical protein